MLTLFSGILALVEVIGLNFVKLTVGCVFFLLIIFFFFLSFFFFTRFHLKEHRFECTVLFVVLPMVFAMHAVFNQNYVYTFESAAK